MKKINNFEDQKLALVSNLLLLGLTIENSLLEELFVTSCFNYRKSRIDILELLQL